MATGTNLSFDFTTCPLTVQTGMTSLLLTEHSKVAAVRSFTSVLTNR